MLAYHEVNPNDVSAALENGLKRTSRGEKGDDFAIMKTDSFLDERRPKALKDSGISRDDNLYAYVAVEDSIIDITNGSLVPLYTFASEGNQSLLELSLDARKCYVSDLDTYDALKAAIETHENPEVLETLAHSYWQKLVPLNEFEEGTIRRPEIMVTYDITPQDITPISL